MHVARRLVFGWEIWIHNDLGTWAGNILGGSYLGLDWEKWRRTGLQYVIHLIYMLDNNPVESI